MKVNTKTLEHILSDAIVGRKIRVWKKNDQYDFSFDSNAEEAICEIISVTAQHSANAGIRLTLNDNGERGSVRLKIYNTLQFVD